MLPINTWYDPCTQSSPSEHPSDRFIFSHAELLTAYSLAYLTPSRPQNSRELLQSLLERLDMRRQARLVGTLRGFDEQDISGRSGGDEELQVSLCAKGRDQQRT